MASNGISTKQRAGLGDRLSDLTTVFVPPCPTTWLLTTTKVPSQFPAFPTAGPVSCDPPSWADNISQKGFAYYSPAICPENFSPACTVNDERTSEGFPTIAAGETAAYCVPSGFTCTSDTTDFRGGVWGFTRTATTPGASVTVGPAIQIRWKQEDLALLATDPLTGAKVPNGGLTQAQSVVSNALGSSSTLSTLSTASVTSTANTDTLGIDPFIPIFPSPSISSSVSTTSTLVQTRKPFTDVTRLSTSPQTSSSSNPLESPTSIRPEETSGANDTNATNVGESKAVSSTTTAAMALSGILILLILGSFVIASIRRYRRYRAGEVSTFFPLRVTAWGRKMLDKWSNSISSHRPTLHRPRKYADAELGTDGPIPELGPAGPLGTKENPAELEEYSSSARDSWRSRVSRIFPAKLRKEVWST
ncbi:uncharacterized protein GGS25DRAFT_426955 [Hypoxylon fragiforme]|uniref:uncharacterized protein n=1 Tax=Hypoxylon fragiforme TaxID=63214 RepID=UPI0020C73275|nr:uncharacterized protein GGS25DRAFT_426955 [Hypoxylon fragiforme]KAI2605348.1 hypothetical protein GGS25DRAFT_426955 [Hypoxylon fragiforme]